jgi:alkylation response protein AidB-like acyl-CoA dehydrogenase
LATVVLDAVGVGPDRVLVEPGDERAEEVLQHALDVATAAFSLSTVATCRWILDTTVAYAKEREQFGRPIGSFQALQHRLADCYLAVERADALAWFAIATVAEDDPRLPVAASMAKSAAGDCQRLLTRDGLQLHGGIGFTWEHDLHLWLKRAAAGELLLGTSAAHRARLAGLLALEVPS